MNFSTKKKFGGLKALRHRVFGKSKNQVDGVSDVLSDDETSSRENVNNELSTQKRSLSHEELGEAQAVTSSNIKFLQGELQKQHQQDHKSPSKIKSLKHSKLKDQLLESLVFSPPLNSSKLPSKEKKDKEEVPKDLSAQEALDGIKDEKIISQKCENKDEKNNQFLETAKNKIKIRPKNRRRKQINQKVEKCGNHVIPIGLGIDEFFAISSDVEANKTIVDDIVQSKASSSKEDTKKEIEQIFDEAWGEESNLLEEQLRSQSICSKVVDDDRQDEPYKDDDVIEESSASEEVSKPKKNFLKILQLHKVNNDETERRKSGEVMTSSPTKSDFKKLSKKFSLSIDNLNKCFESSIFTKKRNRIKSDSLEDDLKKTENSKDLKNEVKSEEDLRKEAKSEEDLRKEAKPEEGLRKEAKPEDSKNGAESKAKDLKKNIKSEKEDCKKDVKSLKEDVKDTDSSKSFSLSSQVQNNSNDNNNKYSNFTKNRSLNRINESHPIIESSFHIKDRVVIKERLDDEKNLQNTNKPNLVVHRRQKSKRIECLKSNEEPEWILKAKRHSTNWEEKMEKLSNLEKLSINESISEEKVLKPNSPLKNSRKEEKNYVPVWMELAMKKQRCWDQTKLV